MKPCYRRPAILRTAVLAVTFVTATVSATAFAAGTAVMQSDDDTTTLMWLDTNTLRLGNAQEKDYMLVRDNKAYAVTMESGTPMVIDMAGMAQMMAGMAGGSTDDLSALEKIDTVKATGGTETVAGIEGRVYMITLKDADGETTTSEAVLTDDSRVVEMTQAHVAMMHAMLGADGAMDFLKGLPPKDRGLLRMGNDFTLKSISDEQPKAELFELPAKPMSFQDMMQGMKR